MKGKQYYHFTQAFSPDDNVTPEKVHQLGKEWVENNIKNHQIYMVTHIDKNHIHNHFVVNSVNMENGKKLQISPRKLLEMKKESNHICEREGLKQIDINRKVDIKKTMAELGMEQRGIITWKDELRQCIDFAKERTKSLEDMTKYLKENFEIETRITKNSISFKHPEQGKSVRGKKLGNRYVKEELENGFVGQEKRIRGTRESKYNKTTRAVYESKNGVREHTAEREFRDIKKSIREVEQGVKGNIGLNEETNRGDEDKQRDIRRGHETRSEKFQRQHKTTVKRTKSKNHSSDYEIER